jgi:hypothetical protein
MFTRATQCVRDVLDPPVSKFSLSVYRHPFLYTLFDSRFTLIINNKANKTSASIAFASSIHNKLGEQDLGVRHRWVEDVQLL